MSEPEFFFNGVRVDEEQLNDLVDMSTDYLQIAELQLKEELAISSNTASAIIYLRSRSRWSQEKEDELVRRDQAGDPIPLSAILSGEF